MGRLTPVFKSYDEVRLTMDTMPLKPERKAQLEEYAQRRGQDPATALDEALATYLEWDRQDFARDSCVETAPPTDDKCRRRRDYAATST